MVGTLPRRGDPRRLFGPAEEHAPREFPYVPSVVTQHQLPSCPRVAISMRRRSSAHVLAGAILVAACGGEARFPSQPPTHHEEASAAHAFRVTPFQLRKVAGPAALDCGVVRDQTSADRVAACATHALREHRPFYCRYDPPAPDTAIGVAPSPAGGVWASPAAYVGTPEGTLLRVWTVSGRKAMTQAVLTPAAADIKPLRIAPGMTTPRLIAAHRPVDTGKRQVSGIAMIEAIVDKFGIVTGQRTVKSLPGGWSTQPRRSCGVRRSHPAGGSGSRYRCTTTSPCTWTV